MRPLSALVLFVALARCVSAETPALLEEAVQKWVADQDRWAYTQSVRLLKDGRVTQERVERYNPSLPTSERWQLLEIAGKQPTAAERKTWRRKKEKELRRRPSVQALPGYFDFEQATVVEETAEFVRYDVPLFPDESGRYPLDKFTVCLTVRKDRRVLDRLTAGLRESFRMALGSAQVTDLGVEIRFRTIDENFAPQPEAICANSALRVAQMFKVDGRAELGWSDFKRVIPYENRATRNRG